MDPVVPDTALTARARRPEGTRVSIGSPRGAVEVGGRAFVIMAGPCAVESQAQIEQAAEAVAAAGCPVLRGGAFKPRTSPYSFQGLGEEGARLLARAARQNGLATVSEILDASQLEALEDVAVLQVGARSMQNFSLLQTLARCGRPVLLKRGLSATIDEWLLATEYLLAGGNDQVILCERGIRTFETATRNTLDLGAVALLKQRTHLPVLVDPSHSSGRRELVIPLSLAAAAAGADGLLVDVHPHPDQARCDGAQALLPRELHELVARLDPLLSAVGRTLFRPEPMAATNGTRRKAVAR